MDSKGKIAISFILLQNQMNFMYVIRSQYLAKFCSATSKIKQETTKTSHSN